MAIDYGDEYATILGGQLVLDLSPNRVTGPMVPVIRVARAWLEIVADSIELTMTEPDRVALLRRIEAAALAVEHVLRVDRLTAAIGTDKVLRVSGDITVGGDRAYPLIVGIDQLGAALASIGK